MISEKNLVWLDLEMTGLNPDLDTILEIATIITDNNLTFIEQGPHLVIHQPNELLEKMDEWNRNQHKKSGLVEAVKKSTISLAEAEQQTLKFIKQYCIAGFSPLCGNSIFQDRAFIRRLMPALNAYLHYRLIDVSTVKELVKRWYPTDQKSRYEKKDIHRALDDVYASIEELKQYRTYFFVNQNTLS
ncbi:MAG: oligoribonuclease [Candidatus Babeliaceae bacterium]